MGVVLVKELLEYMKDPSISHHTTTIGQLKIRQLPR